jgi:hypothetical protein
MPPNFVVLRPALALIAALVLAATGSPVVVEAQEPKAGEEKKQAGDGSKENPKKVDEIAEAAQLLKGPAGQPECVWVGRRIVSLLWRDDLDTAEAHQQLYERFGCPAGHVQVAFRCVVRLGEPVDPKSTESLNLRVHMCWVNPEHQPGPAAEASTAPAAPAPQ